MIDLNPLTVFLLALYSVVEHDRGSHAPNAAGRLNDMTHRLIHTIGVVICF